MNLPRRQNFPTFDMDLRTYRKDDLAILDDSFTAFVRVITPRSISRESIHARGGVRSIINGNYTVARMMKVVVAPLAPEEARDYRLVVVGGRVRDVPRRIASESIVSLVVARIPKLESESGPESLREKRRA